MYCVLRSLIAFCVYSFRCHLYNLYRCPARITITEEEEFEQKGQHVHAGDRVLLAEFRFINECKRRAANGSLSLRQIFNSVISL
jgi:hypothetical protein